MKNSSEMTFDDMQGLVRYGHGALTETCFMLLNIIDVDAAKDWINDAPVSSASQSETRPETALQIAFSAEGLHALGVNELLIKAFSDEFIVGMSGDESRSRRLGDVSSNAPEHWLWGGQKDQVPHILLMLYARENKLESWQKTVEGKNFVKSFQLIHKLPTQFLAQQDDIRKPIEPFGFRDGISQPKIDWECKQSTDTHKRSEYSNLLAPGEVVLGYPNEYGQYTTRPLLDPYKDANASMLEDALDQPGLKDFARNGSYLVLRQLAQDVPGFWKFMEQQEANKKDQKAKQHSELANAMVGRELDGTPLMPLDTKEIPGTAKHNNFTYQQDPQGMHCPMGAHIRRTNPRNGDLPAGGSSGCISRLLKIIGLGASADDEDLIASTRFHRIIRRGRSYGSLLKPGDAIKFDAQAGEQTDEKGLQFICLVANISRQFEFVQNAWVMNSKFAGLKNERDPLLGHREPLTTAEKTDHFFRPDSSGPTQKTCQLPQFITVRGGAYFFMPGLSALQYIAAKNRNSGEQ